MKRAIPLLLLACLALPALAGAASFVNWEIPHVHPLELTPDGQLLLAVNTADNRLELFDVGSGTPVATGSVPVGLRPVSVRARSNDEAWVVNQISDSVSVVDLDTGNVVATLDTLDEPADVVFADLPERAFVSCSQADAIQVFDASAPGDPVATVPVDAEDPRALAVSADGSTVYAAVFESGNATTVLGGGSTGLAFPPNVVNDEDGPWGGQNPPPNSGSGFEPPLKPAYQPDGSDPAPAVGLIVRKDAEGRWLDDNGGDWTAKVTGSDAASSGRPPGWDLPDRDVALIDAGSLEVSYESRLMNLVMALAVDPASGEVTAVGTDATNEIRFEPNLNGRFLRVEMARVAPGGATAPTVVDLNAGHLTYSDAQIAAQSDPVEADPALRQRSIGDPRGIVWLASGERGYVTGMGSNNLIIIDPEGRRLAPFGDAGASTVEVGEGPTGLALDEAANRLYVLNKFSGSVSALDLASEQEVTRVGFFDPTPAAVRQGRPHLYDTHATSGLGHVSCGSCHVNARIDRLAWDLGNPQGEIKPIDPEEHNLGMNVPGLNGGFEDFHPMKGPMTTQTLQDIIGKEPHHWRGDRDGLEEFNPAFRGLLADDEELTDAEMQEFEDFLATIHFPPNPFRALDNSLPAELALPGHFSDGRFAQQGGLSAGDPLPPGDAQRGLALFRPPVNLDSGSFACAACHTLPTGAGGDVTLVGNSFQEIPPGPNGEHHLALVSVDGSTNVSMKVPQLRNLYDKVGFEMTKSSNAAGFGFLHDGSIDSIARFVSEPVFSVTSDQDVADLVAFLLSFSGSDLPAGSTDPSDGQPPGVASQDAHAAVGLQATVTDADTDTGATTRVDALVALADAGEIGLVAKGIQDGLQRGYEYIGSNRFQSDREAETIRLGSLLGAAAPGSEVTFTAVVAGTQHRIGIERDGDGYLDRDELDVCADPADPDSTPENTSCAADASLAPSHEPALR